MTNISLKNERFTPERGLRVTVQVPQADVRKLIDAVLAVVDLKYGDYDSVSFRTAIGTQQFRSLGSGRNSETSGVVDVPCVELSFFLAEDEAGAIEVLKTIYAWHPYEEPVVFVDACVRTLHIRGMDEGNPNRFWNKPAADWVPQDHR